MTEMVSVKYLFICFVMIFIGCSNSGPNTGGTGADKKKNITLVSKAKNYISGGPTWFLPAGDCIFGAGNGTTQNLSGAIAYSQYAIDDLTTFRNKIINASRPDQSSWSEYSCVGANNPCGFPFASCLSIYDTDAGIPCFGLVVQALRDAGYNVPSPPDGGGIDCNYLYSICNVVELPNIPRIGDLVLYDWDKDNSYDHVGIITGNTDYTDQKFYLVISVIDLVREFQLGAAERRLGIFEDIPNSEGGDSDFNYKIVRPI